MPDRAAGEDRIARLRLIRSDNIGPVTYFQLLARFGSATAALEAIPDLAARGGGRAPKLAPRLPSNGKWRRWSGSGLATCPRAGAVPAAARGA